MSHSQWDRTDLYTARCMAVTAFMGHSQFHRIEAYTETCMPEPPDLRPQVLVLCSGNMYFGDCSVGVWQLFGGFVFCSVGLW